MKHAAIIGTALLLLVPALLLHPPMLHDSFWIDWVWADQFNAALRSGVLYPRWLPLSHGGLGSPVFYFYPPLAFYVSGAFGLLGLSTYATIIGAFAVGLIASGYAMYAWLRSSTNHPLLGAILYMAAPYHLLDFYGRGALAEFIAIALIPLVALGLRDRRAALLAMSYGALIFTHLPTALIVSVFLIAPYALSQRIDLRWLTLNLLIGIGLAAIYLIPAFALESYRDAAALWTTPSLQPQNWSLWAWGQPGPNRNSRILVLAVTLSMAAPLLLIRRERVLASYATLGCVLALGLIPAVWELPIIHKVQFPFRILPLVEFTIATSIAKLAWSRPIMGAAAIPPLAMSVFIMSSPAHAHVTWQQVATLHPDVPENLPPGNHPRTWPSQWALELARANPGSSFYFPTLACNERPATRMMLVPKCNGRTITTGPEKIGLFVSLSTALLLFFAQVIRLGQRTTRADRSTRRAFASGTASALPIRKQRHRNDKTRRPKCPAERDEGQQ